MGSNRRSVADSDPLARWVSGLVAQVAEQQPAVEPLDLVGWVAGSACEQLGLPGRCELSTLEPSERRTASEPLEFDLDEPPGGWANPWLPGLIHEQALSRRDRQARGAWYTPPSVVRGLVRFLADVVELPPFAVDPTCGGGAFLLAVLDHWVADGVAPSEALGRVAGFDLDPGAVAVARLALRLWAAGHGLDVEESALDITVADALTAEPRADWPAPRLVIGNPPFATPLKRGAVPPEAAAYRDRHSGLLGQYADLAAIHLHRALDVSPPESTVMLVLPHSVLSSRDVAPLRDAVAAESATVGLWAAREAVFDAGVRACAPIVAVGGETPRSVALASGPTAEAAGISRSADWAICAARALGGPELPDSVVRPVDRLGALCRATAGFRDEYYGLVEAAEEWDGDGSPPNRLVTVGSVDPLIIGWGRQSLRFGGRNWLRPWVPTGNLSGKVERWVERQLVPKAVVATQSKILEPVLDVSGVLVPSTPLLAAHAEPDDLPFVVAVLLAPPVAAYSWERWFGSALSVDALKLAATQLHELPLPPDRRAWEEAAALAATADPLAADREEAWSVSVGVAELMNRAYRADRSVLDWWLDRLPSGARPKNRSVSTTAHR